MARRRLNTLTDVKRYLVNCINRLESGELTDAEAKSRTYISNALAGIIKDSDLETRLAAVEKKMEAQKNEH